MPVQSRPASQPVIGGGAERAEVGSGEVTGDLDGVAGRVLAG
jgi:hypothetical protein